MDIRYFKLILGLTLLSFFNSEAQTYFGVSANLGNQLRYTPGSESLKTPPAISGSLLIRAQEELRNDWVLQQGVGVGILGYNLKVVLNDTLATSQSPPDIFLDYSILYGNLDLLMGKKFSVGEKKLMIGLGGGITYYVSLFQSSSYGIQLALDDNSTADLFYAEINSPTNKLTAFAKIATQLTLTSSIAVGLEYSYHFKPVADGIYEFYHTQTPSAGKISLYQREFNFIFFVKLPKKRK